MLPVYLTLAALAFFYFALNYLLGVQKEGHEPPYISSGTPWIGHALQIFKKKKISHYIVTGKSNLPIYTLPAPRSRIYVATDVALISEMHRKSKTLQFGPYVERFEARVCGVSKAGTAVLTKPGDEATLFEKMTRLLHTDLAQGSELNGANKQLTRHIQSALDRFPTSPTKVRLLEWLRYEMSIGTCRAIWGPENPVNCREMVDAFFTLKSNIFPLLINVFPSVTARSAYVARTTLHHAFVAYYRRNGHAHASQLIRDRFELAREHGLSVEDTASLELSTLFAALSNTVLAAFWAVYHVYSDRQLLLDLTLTKELGVQVKDEGAESGRDATAGEEPEQGKERKKEKVNKDRATPLLSSLVKETIRVHAAAATTRYVAADTTLSSIPSSSFASDDKGYLLKSGSLIVIPTEPVHADPAAWGSDAVAFDPYRFEKHPIGVKTDGSRVNGAAFRGFGGGAHICPGRFLALKGVEDVVSILLRGWELDVVHGDWELGRGVADDVTEAIRPPDGDIEVWFRRRG